MNGIRFETCRYAVKVVKSSMTVMGFTRSVSPCCKHKKVGKRFFGFLGGLKKAESYVDYSGVHGVDDANTERGVAYMLPSINYCNDCRYYKPAQDVEEESPRQTE